MSWINGRASAQAAIERAALASPRRDRDEAIRAIRDDAEACRGTGTGGWSDADIDDHTDECNRQLYGNREGQSS